MLRTEHIISAITNDTELKLLFQFPSNQTIPESENENVQTITSPSNELDTKHSNIEAGTLSRCDSKPEFRTISQLDSQSNDVGINNDEVEQSDNKSEPSKSDGFGKEIYAIFRYYSKDCVVQSISKPSIKLINMLLNDMFEKLAFETSRLVRTLSLQTFSARLIEQVILRDFPHELGVCARSAGEDTVRKYVVNCDG
jgi:hypothetical protein